MNYIYYVVLYWSNPASHKTGYARLTITLNQLIDQEVMSQLEAEYQADEEVKMAVVINYQLLRTEDA